MNTEAELNKVRDEVYRKIGRNLLFIQGIEQKLKNLIAINGSRINSKSKTLDQRLAGVSKKTMGSLAGEFHDAYFVDQGENPQEEVEQVEPVYSFKFKCDDFSTHTQKSLASIVDERNKLVHHFLHELDEGIKGWKDADNRLEQQYDNLVAAYKDLKKLSGLLREFMLKFPSEITNAVSDKTPKIYRSFK